MKRTDSINSISVSMILLFCITFAVLIAGANSISYADEVKVYGFENPGQDLKLETVTPSMGQKIARSGCCSWHGGVCDCIGGRIVCCDGTFSPTCTCNRETGKDLMKSEQ